MKVKRAKEGEKKYPSNPRLWTAGYPMSSWGHTHFSTSLYVIVLGHQVRTYISGKSIMSMVQLIYFTWVTHVSVRKYRVNSRVYLYWPLLTSIVVNDVRATTTISMHQVLIVGATYKKLNIRHSKRTDLKTT